MDPPRLNNEIKIINQLKLSKIPGTLNGQNLYGTKHIRQIILDEKLILDQIWA